MSAGFDGTPGPRLTFGIHSAPGEATFDPRVVGTSPLLIGSDIERMRGVADKQYPGEGCEFLVLKEAPVSGCHAIIRFEPHVGEFYIMDFKSKNGTYFQEPGMNNWECIGDRTRKPENRQLHSLSKVKIADRVLQVLQVDKPKEDIDPFNTEEGGNTKTADCNASDLVLRVVTGPGEGTIFVINERGTQIIGRTGEPSDKEPEVKKLLINDPTRKISKKHVAVVAKQQGNGRNMTYHLVPYSQNGTFLLSKDFVPPGGLSSSSDPAMIQGLPWQKLAEEQMYEFSFGDYFRLGNKTIISSSNQAGPPLKMGPCMLRASSQFSLNLCWEPATSHTAIRAYIVAMSPDGVSGWEYIYGGGKCEVVKDKLKPATPYYFRVQARNAGGLSEWSEIAVHYTNIDPRAPPSGAVLMRALGFQEEDPTIELSPGNVPSVSEAAAAAAMSQRIKAAAPSSSTGTAGMVGSGTAGLPSGGNGGSGSGGGGGGSTTATSAGTSSGTNNSTSGGSGGTTTGAGAATWGRPSPPTGKASSDFNDFPDVEPEPLSVKPISFQKGKLLGQGAQGQVFVARNRATGELMAVKEINVFGNSPEELRENAFAVNNEISLMSELTHDNIVRYIGVNRENKGNYIQMHIFLEYVPGGSLSTMMKALGGPLEEGVAKEYIFQILSGLRYLHSKHVVHRDIKSDNILLAVFNGMQVCKIADFGASKIMKEQSKMASFIGTPYFMAPEVVRGQGADYRCDIWSAGCTLIEMLTGRPPLDHMEPVQALHKIGSMKTTYSLDMLKDVSDPCRKFLSQCLELDYTKRPTAEELLSDPWMRGLVLLTTPSAAGSAGGASVFPATGGSGSTSSLVASTPSMKGRDRGGDVTDDDTSGSDLDSAFDQGFPSQTTTSTKGSTVVASSSGGGGGGSGGRPQNLIKWDDLLFSGKIGQGGFGTVHKATLFGTEVAVKTGSPSLLENLEREAQILQNVRHPNCVLFMGVTRNGEMYGIVTEYMDGGDLHYLVHGNSNVALDQRLRILRDTAKGLVCLHSQVPPVVHRDIKLGNIFLQKATLVAKLGDFGLASPHIAKGSTTLRYAAPELLKSEVATPKSDVYSFGLVIYEVITGQRPFKHLADLQARRKPEFELATPGEIPPPQFYHPLLAELTLACWQPDPARRPTSIQVLEVLEEVLKLPWTTSGVDTTSFAVAATASTSSGSPAASATSTTTASTPGPGGLGVGGEGEGGAATTTPTTDVSVTVTATSSSLVVATSRSDAESGNVSDTTPSTTGSSFPFATIGSPNGLQEAFPSSSPQSMPSATLTATAGVQSDALDSTASMIRGLAPSHGHPVQNARYAADDITEDDLTR